ncbi:helix-turn-helix domain-containing protein [Corynebacterium variabile]|uniref:helix-turn-helix domain-containing protein n=1 Tax=Corynebacterium variabile TaxID=1727 RepID=UPI002FDF6435
MSDFSGQAEAETLERRLAMARGDVARVALLLDYTASRTRQAAPPAGAASLLAAMSDGMPVSEFALQAGLSVRQVHRRSMDAFGMAPTTLRRVLRLHRAAAMLRSAPSLSLAQTAATTGYSDQAHLARECRRLTLTSASAALAEGIGMSDPFKTAPGRVSYVDGHDFVG